MKNSKTKIIVIVILLILIITTIASARIPSTGTYTDRTGYKDIVLNNEDDLKEYKYTMTDYIGINNFELTNMQGAWVIGEEALYSNGFQFTVTNNNNYDVELIIKDYGYNDGGLNMPTRAFINTQTGDTFKQIFSNLGTLEKLVIPARTQAIVSPSYIFNHHQGFNQDLFCKGTEVSNAISSPIRTTCKVFTFKVVFDFEINRI